MSVEDYIWLMREAAKVGVYQVALGGGNPNQHPEFVKILKLTREEYGIVPNYTTNGRGLSANVLAATKKYCGAIALSVTNENVDVLDAVSKFESFQIRYNFHFVLSSETIDRAIDILQKEDVPCSLNAIVFLNYKHINDNSSLTTLNDERKLSIFLRLAKKKHTFKVGFDSCLVSALGKHFKEESYCIEGCDSARFSMFVDENLNAYPCSFMEPLEEGESLKKWGSISSLWFNAPRFKQIREHFLSNECQDCSWQKICRNGCPIFDSVNLCRKKPYLEVSS